jgi:uncharacterized membrane protein YkoI
MTGIAGAAGALLLAWTAVAQEKEVDWKTLESAKVPLEKGLAAAQQKGKPISGKFEMDEGKLQLSVYTAGQGKYWEVVVDHSTGKVSKTEEIKQGEDLSAAKAQGEAMAKSTKSLKDAAEKAVSANPGYRTVSVVPELQGGTPVATVVLESAKGTKVVRIDTNSGSVLDTRSKSEKDDDDDDD